MNTYGDIGNATAGFYSAKLLSHAVPDEVLTRFAHRPVTLPRGETKVVEFRRSKAFAAATTPLEEGVTPEGSTFSYETISVQLQQYGDYAELTDYIEDFSKDNVAFDMLERQGEQVTLTRELLLADVVMAGTNVIYGNGSARNAITKDGTFTVSKVQEAVTALRNQKARMYHKIMSGSEKYETYPVEGCFVAVGPNEMEVSYRKLASSSAPEADHFIPVSRYGTTKPINQHEIGNFRSVRYCITSEFGRLKGKGAASTDAAIYDDGTNADVGQTVVFGEEAFGAVPLRGANTASVYILNAGTARGGDPIGQRGSVGWKMYYAALILQELWMQRLETAISK